MFSIIIITVGILNKILGRVKISSAGAASPDLLLSVITLYKILLIKNTYLSNSLALLYLSSVNNFSESEIFESQADHNFRPDIENVEKAEK